MPKPLEWDGDDKTTDKLLMTKHDDWNYEKEWRSIVTLHDCVYERVGVRRKKYFVKIQPQLIRRIILGSRASKSLRHKAIRSALWSGVAHVNIEQLFVNEGKFGFQSVKLIDTTHLGGT